MCHAVEQGETVRPGHFVRGGILGERSLNDVEMPEHAGGVEVETRIAVGEELGDGATAGVSRGLQGCFEVTASLVPAGVHEQGSFVQSPRIFSRLRCAWPTIAWTFSGGSARFRWWVGETRRTGEIVLSDREPGEETGEREDGGRAEKGAAVFIEGGG